MTYTALLTLAILRDDFSRLDKHGILVLLKSCQREDGRYALRDPSEFCILSGVARYTHLLVSSVFQQYQETEKQIFERFIAPLLLVTS